MQNFSKVTLISTTNLKKIITIITASILISACQPTQQSKDSKKYKKINGETMGTTYNISFKLPEGIESAIIKADIDEKLVAFNNELSTWQDDSTITRFNDTPANTQIKINNDFTNVMKHSKTVYEQSAGSFDPTVKPILDLWGFGKEMRVDRLQNPPTEEETTTVKSLIDFDSVKVVYSMKLNDNKIIKNKEDVTVDFSAIAKGYGVDVIADVLKSKYHINNYMVEIGGEIATSGANPKGEAWKIAIDAPIIHSSVTDRKIIATIRQPVADITTDADTDTKKDDSDENTNHEANNQIASMHLATSGNYRNSIVFDGIRYSHTINPHTGKPVVDGASSVTVADDTVALADGWATALTAMPYKDALNMAQKLDKAVMFIVLKDDVDANKEHHIIDDWQIIETDKMKKIRAGK